MNAQPRVNRTILLMAVTGLLVTLGCSKRAPGDEELGRQISAEAQQGAGDTTMVDVPRLASFQWDRLFVFPPYTPAAKVQQELGFSWPEAARSEKHDQFVLLVFVNEGHVVRFVDLPRSGGDFADASRPGGFNHSEAVFKCRKEPTGRRRCVLATP